MLNADPVFSEYQSNTNESVEYKILIDLSCVAVINDSKIETNE